MSAKYDLSIVPNCFRTNTEFSVSDLDEMIEILYEGQLLFANDVKKLCAAGVQILQQESNICYIHSPVTVCGDIHGQFYDLLEIFAIGGKIPNTNYLFLGDYANRGLFCVETFLLLLALKVRYKNRITLLRGHHDCRQLTRTWGLYDECLTKYPEDITIWRVFTDVFDYLPLCAVIDKQVMCVHGGLSPQIDTLQHISELDRICEIPPEGPMCDLLWSDPDLRAGWGMNGGAGYSFGKDITEYFMQQNGLKMINRSKHLVMSGYEYIHDKRVVTIFSCPNYVGRCGNQGAIMEYDESLSYCFLQFDAVHVPRKRLTKLEYCKKYPDYWWSPFNYMHRKKSESIKFLKGGTTIIRWGMVKTGIDIHQLVTQIIRYWCYNKMPNELVGLIFRYTYCLFINV